ncbi:MAG: ATP synthase F1 subunit gamma [Clostridia bacterium]|nr:ATP synthase F1 subunit gamma [Clostridia bacterium]
MAGSGTRDIKRKIRSVNSTMQITKAMELVSTAKLKRARNRMDITKPYFDTIQSAVTDILGSDRSIKTRYISDKEIVKTLYIVITSDRGLCGGYNANVIKKALENVTGKENAQFLTIGRRGNDVLSRHDYNVVDSFLYISEKPEHIHASQISKIAIELYNKGEVDAIQLVYTRFASTISQVATALQLLPIERSEFEENDEMMEFINYEPSPEDVLRYIIPKYVESTIYGGLIESAASEQAARRVAMESASDNAEEIIDELVLFYNQARQAAITQEISEIVGGAEALK